MFSEKARTSRAFTICGALTAAVGACCLTAPRLASAKVFLSLEEALAQAFPAARHCELNAENRYLTDAQMKRAEALSGFPTQSALVVRYAAVCGGKPAGHAYTDTHRVRTHPEALFFVVGPEGRVAKVEVLSFDEPLDYIPKQPWYDTFGQAGLDPDLAIKHKIPFVTGASLTAQATVQATRRVLAIDQALREAEGSGAAGPGAAPRPGAPPPS